MLLLLTCMLWLVLPALPIASAQSIWSASDEDDLWLVLAEADKGLTILHRKAADAPEHYWRVVTLPGMLSPGGLTAGNDRLWLVYRNLIIQSVEHGVPGQAGVMGNRQMQFWPSLPEGTQLRSIAASGQTLWALVDVQTAAALAAIEKATTPPSTQPSTKPATQTSTQPAATQAATTQPDDSQSASEADTAATQPFEPRAMLLALRMGRWSSVSLPEQWSQDHRSWLVFTHANQDVPYLITQMQSQPSQQLRVYQQRATDAKASADEDVASASDDAPGRVEKIHWRYHDYTAPPVMDAAFLTVQQQLVMAGRPLSEDRMNLTLWVLRPEREEAVQIGSLGFDAPASSNWAISSNGLDATLFMRTGGDLPRFTSMNLMGQVTQEPATIVIEQTPQFVQDPGQMLPVAVVAISIFLMFLVWRRDPNLEEVSLGSKVVLADFGRRIGAMLIDFAPCVFIALLVYRIDLGELYNAWPGRSGSWRDMLPVFLTIGLFIVHTGLSEMFTGRTLGKKLCGLRVISTDGQPPNIWQVLARNGLKSFDLIACYILPILMLVGKYRQRLGDLVGKTLVVMDEPVSPPPDETTPSTDDDSKNAGDRS